MSEQLSKKRVRNKLWILLTVLTFSIFLMYIKDNTIDQMICIMVLTIVFYAILSFLLEHERLTGRILANKTTDFNRVSFAVFITSIVAIICAFFPNYVKPMILLPIVLIIFTSEWLTLCFSCFFLSVITIACNLTSFEVIGCFMIVLLTTMLLLTWEGKDKIYYVLALFSVQAIVPTLLYYLSEKKTDYFVFGMNMGLACVISIVLYLYMDRFIYKKEIENEFRLEDMLESEYYLVKELNQFSKQEFEYAKKVSAIAKRCAKLIEADELICAVAGFYYRIGIIKGDDIATNGYRFATEKCFPEEICNIIYEYQGIIRKPSTIESAIVQMVDAVCNKMDAKNTTEDMKGWNQEIVMYQVLNEYSVKGMYDQSGLSMNNFLKIRDYLVKEEKVS